MRSNNISKTYHGAGYGRLSHSDSVAFEDAEVAGQSNSIENQREYIEEFLKTKPEIIKVDFYMDDGYSGVNFERPSFQKMMQDITEKKIDCIIVKDLSRFGRNYLEVGDYLEQIFPFLGVRFIGINDGYDSKDFSGQTSGMDIAFRNFIYEMYSKDLSGKVKSGVITSMKRGEYHAGCIVYGYEKSADGKGMIVDRQAAAVIRRIFQEVADGKRARILAKELNDEGVPTRLAYKRAKGEQCGRHYQADIWNHNKIHAIIHNRVYQGDMVYRKSVRTKVGCSRKVRQPEDKWIVISDHHEAIVDRELFQKANDSIRKGQIPEYDRSGVKRGIIFCGCCGNRLELRKTKNPYYLCKRKGILSESGCNELYMKKQAIEQAVWSVWQEHYRMFQTMPDVGYWMGRINKLKKQETMLQQKLEHLPVEKMSLYEQFRAGAVTKEGFIREKELLSEQELETKQRIADISAQIETLETKAKTCEEIMDFTEKYEKLEGLTEEFMNEMMEKITVYEDNRVEIVWRYGDEFEI